jgi:glutathione S-transferase
MSLKLTYFDVPARAYPIRTAFKIAGVEFIDERISFQQLKDAKGTVGYSAEYPLGSVPTLTLPDGRVITQSVAIARYAAKQSNLYPSDPLQALVVDELIDTVAEIISSAPQNPDADTKKTLREQWADGKLKVFFNFLSNKLANSPGRYTVGDSIHLSDIYVYSVVKSFRKGNFDYVSADYDSAWPNLGEFVAKLEAEPVFAPQALP